MNGFFTLLTGLAFVSLGTFAQEHKEVLVTRQKVGSHTTTELIMNTGKYEMKEFQGFFFCSPCALERTQSGADEVKVTIKYECEDGVTPVGISVYNKSIGMSHADYDGKNKFFTRSLPKGTYDMFASYMSRYSELYYVFRENVEITKDTTIVLSQTEATNPLSIRTVDHHGNKLYMPVYDTNYQVIDPGTADDFSSLSFFILKDFGSVAAVIGGGYKFKGHETDLFINNISNRYQLVEARVVSVGETYYFNKYVVTDFSVSQVINEPGNFIAYHQKFQVTPKWRDEAEAHVPGYYMAAVYNGDAIIGQRSYIPKMPSQDFTTKFYIDSPKDDNPSGNFNLLVKPLLSDYRKAEEYQPGSVTYDYYFINGPQVLGDKNGLFYINAGYGVDGGFNAPEGRFRSQLYPGHPAFSFAGEIPGTVYGNSCPINSFQYVSYKDENGTENSYYTSNYVGRYGELREADNFAAKESNKYNEDDSYELIVTNENVVVDGLQGKNVTQVVMFENKEDHVAPTLQMLQFKGRDGMISDRFDNAADAMMEFAGGDFSYVYVPEAWSGWYTCGKMEVEAFSSPYGQEEWTSLDIEEIPEMFYMPGFGYFYRSRLENAAKGSENGWYDVKFKLTDPSGNMQIQTISPAFRINKETSIVGGVVSGFVLKEKGGTLYIADEACPATIELYTLEGMMVSKSCMGKMSLEDISSGVYIAKATGKEGIVSTKKIIIK